MNLTDNGDGTYTDYSTGDTFDIYGDFLYNIGTPYVSSNGTGIDTSSLPNALQTTPQLTNDPWAFLTNVATSTLNTVGTAIGANIQTKATSAADKLFGNNTVVAKPAAATSNLTWLILGGVALLGVVVVAKKR